MLEKEVWQTRAGKLICLVIWLALAYIVLQYGMGLLLPFLFALAVAIPTSSLARHSQKRLGGNRRAWVYFYVFVFFGGILLFVGVIVGKAISEMLEFLEYISENKDELQAALDRIASFPKDLPLLNRISSIDVGGAGEYISGIAESIAKSMAQSGGETVMAALGAAVVSTPRMLISVVVAVLSSLYLALDYDEIKEYLYSLAAEDKREGIERLARRIGKGVRGYLGAYGKLFLIIAAELYIGLLGLGRGYALLVALLIDRKSVV